MTQYERFLDTFFNTKVMAHYWPDILQGFFLTLEIAVMVVICGLVAGLVLAMIRCYRIRVVNFVIVVFADLMRALPPLVLILILYFGLPNLGVTISGVGVLWLVLTLVLAAFAEEGFWGGIRAVPQGQWQAARSCGMTQFQTLLYVVMPQAIRMSVAPVTNRTIAIIKNSALGMVIGVGELLGQATSAQSFSANATPLTMATIAYLVIFIPLIFAGRRIEKLFVWRAV